MLFEGARKTYVEIGSGRVVNPLPVPIHRQVGAILAALLVELFESFDQLTRNAASKPLAPLCRGRRHDASVLLHREREVPQAVPRPVFKLAMDWSMRLHAQSQKAIRRCYLSGA